MNDYYKRKWWWRVVYTIWPPFLRILEWLGFHFGRQPFYVGKLRSGCTLESLSMHLLKNGFEHAILSWKDEGEIMNLRKVDSRIFQYHIRLFSDMEIRAHYEYSSEGNPIRHILEWGFEPRTMEVKQLIKDFLS